MKLSSLNCIGLSDELGGGTMIGRTTYMLGYFSTYLYPSVNRVYKLVFMYGLEVKVNTRGGASSEGSGCDCRCRGKQRRKLAKKSTGTSWTLLVSFMSVYRTKPRVMNKENPDGPLKESIHPKVGSLSELNTIAGRTIQVRTGSPQPFARKMRCFCT